MVKEPNGEIINLIDLGKTVQCNARNENGGAPNEQLDRRKTIRFNEQLFVNLEQSALFSELTGEMNTDEPYSDQANEPADDPVNPNELNESSLQSNDLSQSGKHRRSLLRNRLKSLSINNPINNLNNTRNNYEKLTDSLLVKTAENSKYYGSFSRPKQSETAFNRGVPTSTDDERSIEASMNSQSLLNVYLKQFEQEKHLSLLGFKTVLIVILSFCFLIVLIYTFKVYYDLSDEKLKRAELDTNKKPAYWRATWIVNSILSLLILLIGIIGLLKEKVILILITSVCMMLSLMESDDPIDGKKIFNISLLIILCTSVLLIIFAARLRCYAEDKLNLINKIQYNEFQYMS